MADRLKRAAARLDARRTACASSAVEYWRGGVFVSDVDATPGATSVEAQDEGGFTVMVESSDFIVLAADLEIVPAVGDVIVFDGRKFEVNNLGRDKCWRWSDRYNTSYRIHTKDVGTA